MSVEGEWRADPTGRFAWRRWQDGWGDQVRSADGVAATDPYPYFVHGSDPLDVVGESYRQEALLLVAGVERGQRVQDRPVVAYLEPDLKNAHDPSAVAVYVAGHHVGFLPRALAAVVQPALIALLDDVGSPVATTGVISGGGWNAEGQARDLGVFLHHDATVFGLQRRRRREGAPDTGMGTAMAGSGFEWVGSVPAGNAKAIRRLRTLLGDVQVPIERHFIHLELVQRLYKVRDDFGSALTEFDAACEAHHAEMAQIRPELLRLVDGRIPRISTYKQAAIRHAKAKDFAAAFEWAIRGLEVYRDECHDPALSEDLEKRADGYRDKLKRSSKRRPASL